MPNAISVLLQGDTVGFDQALAVYQEAIEQSEQKTAAELNKLVRDPRYVFLVSRTGGQVDAFAILFFPGSGEFWLLEYMAVDRRLRSQGQGERIFLAAKDHAERRSPGLPGVLEVDQPGAAVAPGNDPVRRLQFYRRMRCRVISGLDYILPLDVSGAPPPMMLLIHGEEHQSSMPREKLRDWLTVLYHDVYERPRNDPRIDAMVSHLPSTLKLLEL